MKSELNSHLEFKGFPQPERPDECKLSVNPPLNEEDSYSKSIEDQVLQSTQIKNQILEQKYVQSRIDMEERKKYSFRIFKLICYYYGFVGLVIASTIILTACELKTVGENVIITLISVTLVNTIGLFIIVARYLFKVNLSLKNKGVKS